MEGLQVFKIYLKYFGFSECDIKLSGQDHFRYVEFHGGIERKQRTLNREMFNNSANKTGAICKIIMVSQAGAEGLNLYNVRQVHLMEPHWHEVRMVQMIGRAIRLCGHRMLPLADRNVDVFRYRSVRDAQGRWTTDQIIEDFARSKDGLIQSFLNAIKEVAVDCVLYKTHNSLVQDYKCFQFDEPSLFEAQIGPAYKEDIYDDARIGNGSNNTKSKTIRIKVIKIKAVKQLSEPSESIKKYSNVSDYWYYPDSGVAYDYDLFYPIGKIGYDNDNIPLKTDKDEYILTQLVPIPLISGNE
jgi:hypothetical protein